jgi:hypothetical protein
MHDPKHPTFHAPKNPNAKIWRFIDIQKFWSLLEKEALHFSKVTTFEDPYEGRVPEFNKKMGREVYTEFKSEFKSEEAFENFLKVRMQSFEILYNKNKETTLVNCWHLNEYESASMWKLYSTNSHGIAIQSTYKKLSDSFTSNNSDLVYIGEVIYSDFAKEWMDERNAYTPFITKRKSFESERELRAVTALPWEDEGQRILSNSDKEREKTNPTPPRKIDPSELTKNGKLVQINLETLIENIFIAPLATEQFEDMVRSITTKIKPNLVSRITKSDLYTLH